MLRVICKTPKDLVTGELVIDEGLELLVITRPRKTNHAGGETFSANAIITKSPYTRGLGALGDSWTIQGNQFRRLSVLVFGPEPLDDFGRAKIAREAQDRAIRRVMDRVA